MQDYIATVVMDRPPVNAQNSEFRQELIATFDSLTDRDDVRVAILTGTGKMFSAGADMKERPDPDIPANTGTSTVSRANASTPSPNAPSR